jgi:hypothetical protein
VQHQRSDNFTLPGDSAAALYDNPFFTSDALSNYARLMILIWALIVAPVAVQLIVICRKQHSARRNPIKHSPRNQMLVHHQYATAMRVLLSVFSALASAGIIEPPTPPLFLDTTFSFQTGTDGTATNITWQQLGQRQTFTDSQFPFLKKLYLGMSGSTFAYWTFTELCMMWIHAQHHQPNALLWTHAIAQCLLAVTDTAFLICAATLTILSSGLSDLGNALINYSELPVITRVAMIVSALCLLVQAMVPRTAYAVYQPQKTPSEDLNGKPNPLRQQQASARWWKKAAKRKGGEPLLEPGQQQGTITNKPRFTGLGTGA